MSVRVAYVVRGDRGLRVSALRLIGASTDERWDAQTDDATDTTQYARAAEWLKGRLHGARSRDALEMVVLDASGAVCQWITTPSAEPRVVAALARQGPVRDDAQPGAAPERTPVSYFAPSELDSSVQVLGGALSGVAAPKRARGQQGITGQRVATMAVGDLPARLLGDALDSVGVRVGGVCSIWHAMAQAWDPSANTGASRESIVARSDPLCAVLLVDEHARLLWCWSQGGGLIAGGSIRLRAAHDGDDGERTILCTRDDVARLASEWLSWSLQLGRSPQRVICVLPESLGGGESAESLKPGELGEAVAKAWPGAGVDAALHDDPAGATLRRLVQALESTPPGEKPDPQRAIVGLATRPGLAHRNLHVWTAAAIGVAALGLGALGFKWRRDAARAEERAKAWAASWQEPVKEAFPDLRARPGKSVLFELEELLRRHDDKARVPDTVDRSEPVMQELEALSLVLASPNVELRSIQIASDSVPRVVAITPSTVEAEALLAALQRVSGSKLEGWSASIQPVGNEGKREGTYTARWPNKGQGGGR